MIKWVSVAMLLVVSTSMRAQVSLGNILNKVSEVANATSSSQSSSSGSLLSGLTSVFSSSKTAKAKDLVGNWSYEEPAIVFSSNNVLKSAGGKVVSATLEKQLQSKLSKYGISKGKMKMTFDNKGNFTQTIAGKTLKGTYTCSGKNVVLKYGGTTQQMIGTTQLDGNDLLIVMDASKLLTYVKVLGTLSGSSSLKTATSLLGSMDGMQCGLRLTK